jgi:ABC-type nitrate/sulfonate/bicarbonate transport system substrate-binding protein
MNRRHFVHAVAGALACETTAPRPGGAQALAHLRVGSSPVDVGGPVYYAADEGFFKKHGLDVEIVTTSNGPATVAAIVSGSLDVGSGNALSITQAHDRGVNFVFVAPSGGYTSSDPTAGLVVAKTSTAKSVRDFAGKTFGVNTVGALGQIAICAWLDKNGVDWRTARFVELPYSAMVPLRARRPGEHPAADRRRREVRNPKAIVPGNGHHRAGTVTRVAGAAPLSFPSIFRTGSVLMTSARVAHPRRA